MRVLRTAAVLILLALSLGTSAFAAKARPAAPARSSRAAAPSAAGVFAPLWRLAVEAWAKEGCAIEPWGRCGASAQTQDADSGCGIDPLGRCSASH
jgi:anti-sigma factor RsiW